MKYRFVFFISFLAIAVVACMGKYPKADNELAAAQYFLKACMQGDFKRADFYMLKDSENIADLKQLKEAYHHSNRDIRAAYDHADIIVEDNESVNADMKIITYKNSYDNINRKLKAVNLNGDWKIDLKYTVSGNL